MAKVLILEQSKSMRNNLRERLEYECFSTEGAETPELAQKMCEKIPFDIILSDRAEPRLLRLVHSSQFYCQMPLLSNIRQHQAEYVCYKSLY